MSERNPKRFENGSSAQERSPEEQRRLMEEYDQARYEEAFPADEETAFNERMAERERQEEYDANMLTESRVMENAEAHRMYMMAQQIAELKANGGEASIIADKEDKLQELLLSYTEKAHTARDLEFRNAEMERDTVKGRDIRASKELAAEAELAKRLEEADFIVNSTDDAWVREKTSKSSEVKPVDLDKNLVKDVDHARVLADIEELSRLMAADPEAARKNGAYDKLRDLMRQIDEILAKAKDVDKIGEPKDVDIKDDADKIGEPKDTDVKDTDEIGEPKDVDVDDKDKIGEPKDVDIKDDADKIGEPKDTDVKDTDEIGEPKDVVLTEGEEDENNPGRRPNVFRRAYNRVYLLFATHNGPMGVLAHGLERFRDSRRAKVVAAIGALGLVGLGIAGRHYGWYDGGHHGSGASASHSGGGTSTGNGEVPGAFPSTPAELYPGNAHNITPGEGWYEAMSRIGIKDPEVQRAVLQNNGAMEQLQHMGLAYKAPELGGWGLNMSEKGLPDAALDILTNAAKTAR